MNFQAFTDEIRQKQWNVFGAEVYEDGKLVRQYGDTQTRHPIYSATKTITALAVGMAVDAGKMDVRRSVLDYLPQKAVQGMRGEQWEAYRWITLERLMTMSVDGYPFRPLPSWENWLQTSLDLPVANAQRPVFHYSNIATYLTGVAASCALDEDLYSFLERSLFAPLGIEEPPYGRCPDGYFYGASYMELSVNELSRIGMLLYNGGVYQGQRIVSEAFVKEAGSLKIRNREGGYGYYLWKYRDGFCINGKWGQKCYVLPARKQMITYLSHMEDEAECDAVTACMEKHLLARPEEMA